MSAEVFIVQTTLPECVCGRQGHGGRRIEFRTSQGSIRHTLDLCDGCFYNAVARLGQFASAIRELQPGSIEMARIPLTPI